MSWFTTKAIGQLAEKRLCRFFERCGWDALRHEGPAEFDLTVQATIEVKHDLRAAATGHVAIELAARGERRGLLDSRAAYWALVAGDEAILVRTEVLRRAVANGPWCRQHAGDRSRQRVALVPLQALKELDGAQVVGQLSVVSCPLSVERPSTRPYVSNRHPQSELENSLPLENANMDHFVPQPLPEYDNGDNSPEAPGGKKLTVLVSLANVMPQPVRWLWPGKVAIGKLTLVAGEPGAGKSFALADLAARVSRQGCWDASLVSGQSSVFGGNGDSTTSHGPSPGNGQRTAGHGQAVLFWNTHDELADTIRPRLDAAGADVSKITAVERTPAEGPEDRLGPPRPLNECRDVENLEVAIDRTAGCRLVVIDTLPLRTSGRGLHRESLHTLQALADLARRRNVAVVAVVSLPQAPLGAAWEHGLKMLAAVPEVRAVWNICHDREQPERRLMLPVKNNLVEGANGLAFRLTAGRVEWESDPVDGGMGKRGWGLGAGDWGRPAAGVEDLGPGTCGFGDSSQSAIRNPQSAILFEAAVWLREALADGPMESKDLLRLAGANGFSSATLRRVKQAAGVVSRREGFGPGAVWRWGMGVGAPGAETVPGSKFRVSGSQEAVSAYGTNATNAQAQNPQSEAVPGSKFQVSGSEEAVSAYSANAAQNPQSEIRNPQSNLSAYGENAGKTGERPIGAQAKQNLEPGTWNPKPFP